MTSTHSPFARRLVEIETRALEAGRSPPIQAAIDAISLGGVISAHAEIGGIGEIYCEVSLFVLFSTNAENGSFSERPGR